MPADARYNGAMEKRVAATIQALSAPGTLGWELRQFLSVAFWLAVYRRFEATHSADLAAGLAYYVLFSMFPGILVVAAVVDFVWSPQAFFESAAPLLEALPPEAQATLRSYIQSALSGSPTGFFSVGALSLLWAGSGWFRATGRAVEYIYGVQKTRSFLSSAGFGIRMLLLFVLLALGVVATLLGPELLARMVDFGMVDDYLVRLWHSLRWPLVCGVLALSTDLLYSSAARPLGRWRIVSAGGLVAVGTWIVSTLGMQLYFAFAATTSLVYGALSGVVALLLWSWLFNVATLLGAVVNAELQLRAAPLLQASGGGGPTAQ
jgi:membrane protein